MSIASMTGFSRARGSFQGIAWSWELKSVNGRNLDLRLRTPQGLDVLEGSLRDLMAKAMTRGSVQALLTIDRPPRPPQVLLNTRVLDALLETARTLNATHGVAMPTMDGLLALRGVVDIVDTTESDEERNALQAAVLAGFAEATNALVASRQEEGRALAAILNGHVDTIEALVARAETVPGRKPEAIRARLAEGLAQIMDAAATLDPVRLHQEAILIATKADVREEIDRLKAHIDHARRLLAEGASVGRKLDFLAQEFNREANTLCSKSNDRELTEIGLALKATVDQLREQIQNVE